MVFTEIHTNIVSHQHLPLHFLIYCQNFIILSYVSKIWVHHLSAGFNTVTRNVRKQDWAFLFKSYKKRFCEKSNHSVTVILCLCYSFLLQYRWRRWWVSNLRWCQGHETPGEGKGAKIWGGGGVWPSQVFKATSVHWTYRRWLFVCQCSKIRWFEWSVLLYILHNRVRRYVKMLQVIQIQTTKAHIYWFMDFLYFHSTSLSQQNISISIGSYICFVTKIFVSHFRMTILLLGVPTVQSSCTLSWDKHTQMTFDLISL